MSLHAEFSVPREGVVLSGTLADLPAAVVEFRAHVPAAYGALPFLALSGETRPTFESRAADDPTVETLSHLSEQGDEHLYRATWRDLGPFIDGLRSDATVVRARGTAHGWQFGIRFGTRGALEYFRAYCDRADLRFGLTRLADATKPWAEADALTRDQHEALALAAVRGYFEIPRECTLTDLAAELDISARAVSERLLRGEANLIGATLR